MRILITGSSGRIGSAVARLLDADHEVIGLDRVPGAWTTHLGRVEDPRAVGRAMGGADAVVHTASLHAPQVGRASASRFRSVNVVGTRILLEEVTRRGVAHFVYTSTTSVYGHALEPAGRAVWVSELLEPRPRDIYDETKLAAESLCREASRTGGLSCVVLRVSRCFPEPDDLLAIYRLYRGVDLDDVARAHELALAWKGRAFEVFNISARSPFTPGDCTALLTDAASVIRSYYPGIDEIFSERGWQLPRSIDRVYAIEAATGRLGYRPNVNFAEFLEAGRQRTEG
jgi:nucleoside-diphosphate-sugar epimerase